MLEERYRVKHEWVGGEEFREAVNEVFLWFSNSTPLKVVQRRLEGRGLEKERIRLVIDVSRTRFKAREKFSRWREVFFTPSGLRWATPEEVGAALQRRLKGYTLLDVGCGQGGQLIHRKGEVSAGVDIDPINIGLAGHNLSVYGVEAELVAGDGLDRDVIRKYGGADVIFSDPYRGPTARVRRLEDLKPSPLRVMEMYGEKRVGFVFEVPPYIQPDRIPFEAELEFVSFRGRYNRLNLFTGELRRCSRSVLILPEGLRIGADEPFSPPPPPVNPFSREFGIYVYEVDPALARSGLLGEAIERVRGEFYLLESGRRTLLTSDTSVSSPIFRGRYRVLKRLRTLPEVKRAMEEENFSRASLRFTLDPGDYWMVRRRLEDGLPEGGEKATIFKVSGVYLLTVLEEVRV